MTEDYIPELPERYDKLQKMALPYWETFFGTVTEYIPNKADKILELASGTGFLTSMIRETHPDADITCLDINPEMIAVAKRKAELKEVTFIEGDITKKLPEGPYDVVVLTQCLFALPKETILSVLKEIHSCLKKGGVFVYGDIFQPESKWETDIYTKHWREVMLENGMSSHETEIMLAPLEKFIEGYSLSIARDMLKKAGFYRVFCPYFYEMYGVMVAFTEV